MERYLAKSPWLLPFPGSRVASSSTKSKSLAWRVISTLTACPEALWQFITCLSKKITLHYTQRSPNSQPKPYHFTLSKSGKHSVCGLSVEVLSTAQNASNTTEGCNTHSMRVSVLIKDNSTGMKIIADFFKKKDEAASEKFRSYFKLPSKNKPWFQCKNAFFCIRVSVTIIIQCKFITWISSVSRIWPSIH